jgi:transketolase
MTLDGSTDNTFKENVIKRFESFGFDTFLVDDGNDLDKINCAIEKAKKSEKPSFIEVKTKLGYGSNLENTNKVHGKPLDMDDIIQLKKKLNISNEPFYVNEKAKRQLMDKIESRTHKLYEESIIQCSNYVNDKLNKNIDSIKELFEYQNYNIMDYNYDIPSKPEATRVTNQKVMSEIANNIEMFIGGSADLNSSTKAYLTDFGDISSSSFSGRNIWFGIREHAMGAIMNGLALLKLRPFGSTFLCFSDYLKPAIRMSALMHLPVTYVFTHDSILVGEDGPTHQPVEQLVMLRSIPNLNVYRPADAKELIGCWQSIINNKNNPSSLVLSRSDVVQLENTSSLKALKGGYVLEDDENIELVIIATGTELSIAHKIKQELKDYHIRVVSMPSKEVFLNQDKEYQLSVLPNDIKRIVIEASSSYNWYDITNYVIGVDVFGKSSKPDELLTRLNFSYDQIKNRVIEILSMK